MKSRGLLQVSRTAGRSSNRQWRTGVARSAIFVFAAPRPGNPTPPPQRSSALHHHSPLPISLSPPPIFSRSPSVLPLPFTATLSPLSPRRRSSNSLLPYLSAGPPSPSNHPFATLSLILLLSTRCSRKTGRTVDSFHTIDSWPD